MGSDHQNTLERTWEGAMAVATLEFKTREVIAGGRVFGDVERYVVWSR
jgi:hypothetical protein